MTMLLSNDKPQSRLATRLAFLAAGFGLGAWAPLVPFVKAHLGVNDATIGMLLLGLGGGSMLAMPLSAAVGTRIGSRPIILGGGIGMAAMLPVIALVANPAVFALALFLFGAALGAIDVAMNTHALEVENASGRSLMSGFHAMFSLGGFIGSGGLTFLLSTGAPPFAAAALAMVLTLILMGLTAPGLLRTKPDDGEAMFAIPRGIVLLIALLACLAFLTEGAMLDWGALLITETGMANAAHAGAGYMLFSVAMMMGRFAGDAIIVRYGRTNVLRYSAALAVAGFILLLTAPVHWVALAGFALIGLGAANVVPILFGATARQSIMPVGLALAAVSSCAYAGMIAGPAFIGFIAHLVGLPVAFWILAILFSFIGVFARPAGR